MNSYERFRAQSGMHYPPFSAPPPPPRPAHRDPRIPTNFFNANMPTLAASLKSINDRRCFGDLNYQKKLLNTMLANINPDSEEYIQSTATDLYRQLIREHGGAHNLPNPEAFTPILRFDSSPTPQFTFHFGRKKADICFTVKNIDEEILEYSDVIYRVVLAGAQEMSFQPPPSAEETQFQTSTTQNSPTSSSSGVELNDDEDDETTAGQAASNTEPDFVLTVERELTPSQDTPTQKNSSTCSAAMRSASNLAQSSSARLDRISKIESRIKQLRDSKYNRNSTRSSKTKRGYRCSRCDNVFESSSYYINHVQAIHMKIKPYHCIWGRGTVDTCQFISGHRISLIKHIKRVHLRGKKNPQNPEKYIEVDQELLNRSHVDLPSV